MFHLPKLPENAKKTAGYVIVIMLFGWFMTNFFMSLTGLSPESRWNAAMKKRDEINVEIKKVEVDWCIEKLDKHVEALKETGKPVLTPEEIKRCDDKTRDSSMSFLPSAYAETTTPIIDEQLGGLCYKNTAGEDQNQYVRMASEISDNNIDFLALLDGENGLWTIDRKSCNKNGSCDYGFCQVNKLYHPEIVNDERFFTDARWQLEQCYKLYVGGTTFYAKSKIPQNKPHFTCPNS